MTTFKHKNLPIEIPYSEYAKLSTEEKNNFIIVNTSQNVTNNISNTNIKSETKDVLGLGEVATVVVVAPLVAVGALFGFFD